LPWPAGPGRPRRHRRRDHEPGGLRARAARHSRRGRDDPGRAPLPVNEGASAPAAPERCHRCRRPLRDDAVQKLHRTTGVLVGFHPPCWSALQLELAERRQLAERARAGRAPGRT
jgi:hypothetical protein